MTVRPHPNKIHLNESQLLEVQEYVRVLEEELEQARIRKSVSEAIQIHVQLKVAREVLDQCLAFLPAGTEH